MSIYVISWAWDHSRAHGGTLLTLLAIADCAHQDGSGAWPSNKELQRKARLSDRQIQRAIAELVRLGELEVEYNAGPNGVNRYRVIMTPPDVTPDKMSGSPPTFVPPPPDKMSGVTVSEPSIEPSSGSVDKNPEGLTGPRDAGSRVSADRNARTREGFSSEDETEAEVLARVRYDNPWEPAPEPRQIAAGITIDDLLGYKPDVNDIRYRRKVADIGGDYPEPIPILDPPLSAAEKTVLRLAMRQAGIPLLKGRLLDDACAMVLADWERAGNREPVQNRANFLRGAILASPHRFKVTPQP